jgi:hypothetical protein
MHRAIRVFGLYSAALALALACGARTGLEVTPLLDASVDAPLLDAHALDVMPDCNSPAYCDPANLGYVYKCKTPICQCGSLEQCVEPSGQPDAGDTCAAMCQNPCENTLGQNTSNGCEFYAVEMDMTEEAIGVCYAVFVVNQWQTGQPARISVNLGATTFTDERLEQFARIPTRTAETGLVYAPFSASAGLAQNQVAILFLSRSPTAADDAGSPDDPKVLANCPTENPDGPIDPPIIPAVVGDAALHGTGIGQAFHIQSNVPIVAYQMLPYGGGHARVTGATLLLPTNVWGTNYIAANAYSFPPMIIDTPGGERAGPTMAIIAQADDTRVQIDPVAAIVGGGGLAGSPAGVPASYILNQGQYLQFTQPAELTGSPILSDKAVAVIGGSTLIDLPLTSSRADSAEQMLPPISALGSEYVAVRYRSRDPSTEESVPWRVVGVVDGTTLMYDPAPPPGAPLSINQGQVEQIDNPGPWVISSQDANHPFYFAQYMTGGSAVVNDASSPVYGQGDPEFVNVITPAQYLSGYTFFTDPTYPETNLVIVAALDPVTNQFPSVNLDCAGTLSGWQPVGKSGKYQFTRFDLSTGNFLGQKGCNNGVHTIEASLSGAPAGDAPAIGVTIWGWGSSATAPCPGQDNGDADTNPNFTCWVSYAYPAGANITKLNSVVVPAN